jgi:hypothetical protein
LKRGRRGGIVETLVEGGNFGMRKFFISLVIAAVSLTTLTAQAATQLAVPVQQPAPAGPASDAIDSNKLLVIGVGVVVGYALASTVWTIQGTTLLGAVAGGLLGNWWYENHAADIVPLEKPRGTPLPPPPTAPRTR